MAGHDRAGERGIGNDRTPASSAFDEGVPVGSAPPPRMAAKFICNECGWECDVDTPIVIEADAVPIQCPYCSPLFVVRRDATPRYGKEGD